LELCLDLLGLEISNLESGEIIFKDQFDDITYREEFYGVTDSLGKLKRFDQEIRFAEAALRTSTGVKSAYIARNIARALVHNKLPEIAKSLYYAAIIKDNNERHACLWARALVENDKELYQLWMTAIDRDPDDVSNWYELGVDMHDRTHLYSEATKFLMKALTLNMESEQIRAALHTNFSVRGDYKQATLIKNQGHIPDFDEIETMKEVRQAHHDLIKAIIQGGKLEYKGTVLFNPQDLPTWIADKFDDLV